MVTTLIAGFAGLLIGLFMAMLIAFENHKLRCQINNRPRTRFEDIDWTKTKLNRYEDTRDILRECLRSGKYYAPAIEQDLDWLLEVVKQATDNHPLKPVPKWKFCGFFAGRFGKDQYQLSDNVLILDTKEGRSYEIELSELNKLAFEEANENNFINNQK